MNLSGQREQRALHNTCSRFLDNLFNVPKSWFSKSLRTLQKCFQIFVYQQLCADPNRKKCTRMKCIKN